MHKTNLPNISHTMRKKIKSPYKLINEDEKQKNKQKTQERSTWIKKIMNLEHAVVTQNKIKNNPAELLACRNQSKTSIIAFKLYTSLNKYFRYWHIDLQMYHLD